MTPQDARAEAARRLSRRFVPDAAIDAAHGAVPDESGPLVDFGKMAQDAAPYATLPQRLGGVPPESMGHDIARPSAEGLVNAGLMFYGGMKPVGEGAQVLGGFEAKQAARQAAASAASQRAAEAASANARPIADSLASLDRSVQKATMVNYSTPVEAMDPGQLWSHLQEIQSDRAALRSGPNNPDFPEQASRLTRRADEVHSLLESRNEAEMLRQWEALSKRPAPASPYGDGTLWNEVGGNLYKTRPEIFQRTKADPASAERELFRLSSVRSTPPAGLDEAQLSLWTRQLDTRIAGLKRGLDAMKRR